MQIAVTFQIPIGTEQRARELNELEHIRTVLNSTLASHGCHQFTKQDFAESVQWLTIGSQVELALVTNCLKSIKHQHTIVKIEE